MPTPKDQKLDCIVSSAKTAEGPGWFTRSMMAKRPITILRDTPPSIKEMLEVGLDNTEDGSAFAIVNDDIILGPEITRLRTAAAPLGLAWAASSFRFDYDLSPASAVQEGQGLDIFVLTPVVARHVIRQIPEFLHIGRGGWDNWMCGWLRKNMPEGRFCDFTHWHCVFHKKHESGMGRFPPFTKEEQERVLHNVSCAGLPNTRLPYPL